MRPKFLTLAGVTKNNRYDVMADVNDAVAGAGGWIMGHTLFSNIAITFKFALAPDGFEGFKRRIAEAGVTLDSESLSRVDDVLGINSHEQAEVTASLNVTFIHDEPDLRREVPAVPG